MVRLFKSLGMPTIMWPGMGSEVNMEIYETNDTPAKHYVRLLVRIRVGEHENIAYSSNFDHSRMGQRSLPP